MKNAIIPSIKYRNSKAALEWLCESFGFEKHLVVEGEDDRIEHAQLNIGDAMIMIGSADSGTYGKNFKTPDELDGINTQAPYLIISDVDSHYDKAVANNAEIILPLKAEEYGGKSYTCRDLEGNIWTFGSYDPWRKLQ